MKFLVEKESFLKFFCAGEGFLWYLKCTPAPLCSYALQVNTKNDLGKRIYVGITPKLELIPSKVVGMPQVNAIFKKNLTQFLALSKLLNNTGKYSPVEC